MLTATSPTGLPILLKLCRNDKDVLSGVINTMKVTKTILLICVYLALMVMQGCSGIQVSQDYNQSYDFSELKTFAWKPNKYEEYRHNNALIDKRIRTAVESNLLAKHYVQAVDKPDFYISYHITVEKEIATSPASAGVVVGGYGVRGYSSIGYGTGSEVYTYDLGTLLVDVTDVASSNLIWRGVSTQVVSKHSDPEKSTQRINKTIGKMLAQFPPH